MSSPIDDSAAVREVIALDEVLDTALHVLDLVTIERLYADEYTINSPANKIQTRAETIELITSSSMQQRDVQRTIEAAYASGDVVVIMGRQSVIWEGTGTTIDGQRTERRFTNVWRRIDGDWRRIPRQATTIDPVAPA